MCFNSANLRGTGEARKKAGGGTKGMGSGRAGYGRREVLTPLSHPPFCQPDIESQFIIIWLIPDVAKYLCLTVYSYPHCAIILVGCTLKFLVDSHIRKLQNSGISMKTSMGTICSKKLIPFYSEVLRPSYKTKSGDTTCNCCR